MISLSRTAVGEIERLKLKQQAMDISLRLQVLPGGCSGLSYQVRFDQQTQPDDHIYESHGVQIVVDSYSLNYLDGLTLDYSEDLMGGAFRFHNPNAIQTCGCGNSFAVSVQS